MLQVIPNWILHWDYEDGSFMDLTVSKRSCFEAMQMALDVMHGIKIVKGFTCYRQEP